MEAMKVILSIVERGQGAAMLKLYRKRQVPIHIQCAGKGTATSEIMDILGLGSSEKDVLLSFAAASAAKKLLHDLDNELRGHTGGAGIVVSIPVSGLNSLVANLAAYHAESLKEKEDIAMVQKTVSFWSYAPGAAQMMSCPPQRPMGPEGGRLSAAVSPVVRSWNRPMR